jgi:hypothetical protein
MDFYWSKFRSWIRISCAHQLDLDFCSIKVRFIFLFLTWFSSADSSFHEEKGKIWFSVSNMVFLALAQVFKKMGSFASQRSNR